MSSALRASTYILLPPPRTGEKHHLTTLQRDSGRANPPSCIHYISGLNNLNSLAASASAIAVSRLNFRPTRLKAGRIGGRACTSARVRTPSQGVAESLTGRRGHDSRGAQGGRTLTGAQPFPPPPLYFRRARAGLAQSKWGGDRLGAQERACLLCFCLASLCSSKPFAIKLVGVCARTSGFPQQRRRFPSIRHPARQQRLWL